MRKPSRRTALLTATGLLVVAGGGLAWADSRPAAPNYRTAVATTGDVQQQLTLTGSAHAVAQAKAAFPVAATVTAVPVTVGDHVTAGQLLATIDSTPLHAAVVAATATLAKAQATLQSDQSTAAPVIGPTPVATPPQAAATSRSSGAAPGAASTAGYTAIALVNQQQATTVAAVAAAQTACGSSVGGAGTTAGGRRSWSAPSGRPSPTSASASPSTSATPATSSSSAASPPADPSTTQPTGSASSCLAALGRALTAEQQLSRAQSAATHALSTSTSGRGTTSTGTTRSSAGISSPAARITLDTAAAQAARVALDTAQRALAAARLTSPITGTVAVQPFAAAQGETPSQAITVIGTGAVQVVADAPSTALPSLRVGQRAAVTPDGTTSSIPGTLTQIGLLPTTAANGTTAYPVTVLVQSQNAALHDGGAAALTITTASVPAALTVPNSALRGGSVTVVTAKGLVPTRVQTGAVGALTVQILSGLKAGQVVLLADPSQVLPANSTTPVRTFGGGGLGGGRGGAAGGPRRTGAGTGG